MAGEHEHPAGRVPFWIHQLVELLLGILLLVQGARTGEHTALLVSLGAVLLLLALCSDGALAAWPWIGRRLHRVLDLVVAATLAVSPLVFGVDHLLAIVILEVAAASMLWLAFRTEWRTKVKEKEKVKEKPTPAPAPPPAATPPAPAPRPAPAPPPGKSSQPAVPVARKLGSAVGKARDDGPRQLGRLVGRAQRAAKAAMAPDPPSPAAPEPPRGSEEPPAASPET